MKNGTTNRWSRQQKAEIQHDATGFADFSSAEHGRHWSEWDDRSSHPFDQDRPEPNPHDPYGED